MLRSLLGDRLGFRFHLEIKEGEVYILRRGSRALQLKPSKDPAAGPRAIVMMKQGDISDRASSSATSRCPRRITGFRSSRTGFIGNLLPIWPARAGKFPKPAFRTNGVPVAGTTIHRSADGASNNNRLGNRSAIPTSADPRVRGLYFLPSQPEEPGANGNRTKRPSRLHIFQTLQQGHKCRP
jgi:hypothetical protein